VANLPISFAIGSLAFGMKSTKGSCRWISLLVSLSPCRSFCGVGVRFVPTGNANRIHSWGIQAMAKTTDSKADADAYNSFASSAVDLSNAHLADSGLLTGMLCS
jgi:hypothetical protein